MMVSIQDFASQGKEILILHDQITAHRFAHSVLITGEPGTGKRTLAMLLASSLMCTSESQIPCGQCSGCRLASAGEHPDITVIEKGKPISPNTAKGRNTIPVDDIREMISLCSRYSFEGGNRAVVIPDAENMTVQAQNSLLKILEEPPQNTFFLLTSSHPDQLLTTVRSRCRPVKLTPWGFSYIESFLIQSGTSPEIAKKTSFISDGSIGKAMKLASDDSYWKMSEEIKNAFFRNRKRSEVLLISSGWKDRKKDADILFDILENDIHSLLHYRLHEDKNSTAEDFPMEWHRFASSASLDRFVYLTEKIRDARRQNTFNVNFQAVIEQLLLAFIGESDQWAK